MFNIDVTFGVDVDVEGRGSPPDPYFNNRESRRSFSTFPPVWQSGQ